MAKISLVFRSLLFNAAFIVVTIFFVAGAFWILFFPRRVVYAHARLWSRAVTLLLKRIVGITPCVIGKENIPPGPSIIAMRHESAWETSVMFLYVERLAFVLKKELLWIPFFGLFLKKLQCISVARGKGRSALRSLLAQGKKSLDSGTRLLIFPEGTRIAPGRFVPLQKGVAFLYERAGVPVVPAVLNSGRVWPRRCFQKYPGVVTLKFLPPIPPGMSRDLFLDLLGRQLREERQTMREEGVCP